MNFYSLVKDTAAALNRFAERKLKPYDPIGEALSAVNTIDDTEREIHRFYCFTQQILDKIPERSPYRKIAERLIRDEGVNLVEWLRLRTYVTRKFLR